MSLLAVAKLSSALSWFGWRLGFRYTSGVVCSASHVHGCDVSEYHRSFEVEGEVVFAGWFVRKKDISRRGGSKAFI